MLLVNDFLEQSADRTPSKTALICDNRRLTFAEIDAMANRMAGALRDRGVRRGDRVVLFLPNSVELAVGIFATLKANAVFVVVNSSTKPNKLTRLVEKCGASVLVTLALQANVAAGVMSQAASLKFAILTGKKASEEAQDRPGFESFDALQADYPASRPKRECIEEDLACIAFTSGSSGQPKGVMTSHRNAVFVSSSVINYLENVPDDVIICALPLSFGYGLYQLLMAFRFGGTLVLERSFAYPAQFLKQMEKEQATGFPGVPTMFSMLLQMDLSKYDFSHLRYLTNAGAAIPPNHIEQLRQRLPQATFYSMYGLTETKRTLYLPPDQLDSRPTSVGVAIPGTEVWLVDEDGRQLGPNEVGELVIRGAHVMRGYWEDPEASAERFRPGPIPGERVCYSGDLFRRDEEGYYYFVARKDDIIMSRGEKVAPKEIEDLLYELPGVVEAAVIGTPDELLGEAIKALIVTENGSLTEKEVLRHCRANLEDFMIPKYVVFCDSLPKTASGKIHKAAIS